MKQTKLCGVLCIAVLGVLVVTGCDDNNRVPTKTEMKAADTKRQAYIDTIPNLTPEERAQMKAHMGGPPAPMPGDAAKSAASGTGSRR